VRLCILTPTQGSWERSPSHFRFDQTKSIESERCRKFFKEFGLLIWEDQNFRRYRFGRILSIRYVSVQKTRYLMPFNRGNQWQAGRTRAKCKQHTRHVYWNRTIFCIWGVGEQIFSCGSNYLKIYTYAHVAPPRINFGPGPAEYLKHFGTDLIDWCCFY